MCVCVCACASSPGVTVAVRAEPHDSVFVGDSDTVERICSHHQEKVKHLREGKEVKKKRTQLESLLQMGKEMSREI